MSLVSYWGAATVGVRQRIKGDVKRDPYPMTVGGDVITQRRAKNGRCAQPDDEARGNSHCASHGDSANFDRGEAAYAPMEIGDYSDGEEWAPGAFQE